MEEQKTESQHVNIHVNAGGPYLVKGSCIIVDKDGTKTEKDGTFALCRCGGSKNKPFCDGSHKQIEFDK